MRNIRISDDTHGCGYENVIVKEFGVYLNNKTQFFVAVKGIAAQVKVLQGLQRTHTHGFVTS